MKAALFFLLLSTCASNAPTTKLLHFATEIGDLPPSIPYYDDSGSGLFKRCGKRCKARKAAKLQPKRPETYGEQ